jgi:uncharacterized protein (TIGR03643 family)
MPVKLHKKKSIHIRITEDEIKLVLESEESKDRIIEMAWEDRTPFDAIYLQFGLSESDVKSLMKKELKFSSYKLWRERVEACKTKHAAKRNQEIDRFKCSMQKAISNNKISKRY